MAQTEQQDIEMPLTRAPELPVANVSQVPTRREPGQAQGERCVLQRQALEPAKEEVPPGEPALSSCELKRVKLAEGGPEGPVAEHEIVIAEESGLTIMFDRKLKGAICGEVWSALEIQLHRSSKGVDFYTLVLDGQKCERRLAVKRMAWEVINEKIADPAITENPLHEIALLEKVQDPGHPNVVGLTAALDDGSTVYLVTPFVGGDRGIDMFDWVADNWETPASEDVIRPLLRQILDGLRYIHSKGICHADMSLENTLVNEEHTEAFIMDFGQALQMPIDAQGRRFESSPDGRVGKPSYRAPEMFWQKPYDGVKVDVFAVGCMAFMMFTGTQPFKVISRLDPQFRRVVIEGDMQGFLDANDMPLLPEQVLHLLQKMMAYKPEDRPLPQELLEDPWFANPEPATNAWQSLAAMVANAWRFIADRFRALFQRHDRK